MIEMATVAELLRNGRESKHLTIQQVADVTKIRTDHLRALEEGRLEVFSAPIYIRGSVKSYASFLKLDLAQILPLLEAELKGTQDFSGPPPLTPQPKTMVDTLTLVLAKLNWKAGVVALAILVVALVIMAIVAAVHQHHGRNPMAGVRPGTYHPASEGDTLALPGR